MPLAPMPGGIKRTLIGAPEIAARVAELAAELDRDYPQGVVAIGILKGSVFFLCDLVRAMRTPTTLDFLQVSSYGSGTQTSGEVQLVKDITLPIRDRDVLVVEDILDSGLTLARTVDLLKARSPRSLRICALLYKERVARRAEISVDYIGFRIDNVFVVGYGLDFDERYRGLPDLVELET